MNKKFKLRKGEISFSENRLIITDNIKSQKLLMLGCSAFCALCVTNSIYNFKRLGDASYNMGLYISLIVLLLSIILILLSWSTKKEIAPDEVKWMKITAPRLYSGSTLKIQLKNRQIRWVHGVKHPEELRKHIAEHFDIK